MSISSQQALALADGFIDKQGSDRSGLVARNTISEVFLIASELVADSQKNLNNKNKNSSGALSASIAAVNPTKSGSVVSMDVEMNFYGKFVNSGVKGTRSGNSTAGYSFKNEKISGKMLKAIEDWIERGHITTRTIKKYSPYGRHETKQRSLADINKSSAYAISKIVKRKGLKPTGFFDKAVAKATTKYGARLGAALKIDIINSFPQA